MKKSLTLLFLCCSLYAAQAQLNDYDANIAHVFEHLDFGEVTTGLLLERARPFTAVDSFDGAYLTPLNKMDLDRFGALYATLYRAALDSMEMLSHPDAYMDLRDSLQFGDTIPLAIFHYDYQRFREDAVSIELLEIVDSQLYDLSPMPTNS